ncbi:hypothetical protein [Rubripirellula tenax]|nr:hypothetical protein [Rubripirellula tenax]
MKPRLKIVVAVVVVLLTLAAIIVPQLIPKPYVATASQQRQFTLNCDFAKFRQIMVRTNATKAIVNRDGMELINESIEELNLDSSKDERPLLNAILGKSKSELDAIRTITVSVNDPYAKVDQLKLRQVADIDTDQMNVNTAAIGRQGNIHDYATTLTASRDGNETKVELTLDMKIELSLPSMFRGRADTQVADTATNALADQEAAITELVIENADKALILPKLK